MKVLLVEDDTATRAVLARAMERAGHAVAEVAGGTQALAAFVAARPDLVVLDVELPDLDGKLGQGPGALPQLLTRLWPFQAA